MFSKKVAGTMVAKKGYAKGSKKHELHRMCKETLSSGDLAAAVKLPPREDLNEWLAVNTVDFFNQANLVWGSSVAESCTAESCPSMSAGEGYEYLWPSDDPAKRPPLQLPASEYVRRLLEWIQRSLDDEKLFPSNTQQEYPKGFVGAVKQIFKRLFRVYAHVYYSHFNGVVAQGQEATLNTQFKHLYLFIKEFGLVDKKELAPLSDLIRHLTGDKVD